MHTNLIYTGSESDADDKGATSPVITGPPPPPLRGIPHLNPDTVDISDNDNVTSQPARSTGVVSPSLTTVLPPQSQPIRPTLLTTGELEGARDHPTLHTAPLLTSPHSLNFQRTLSPQIIHHGQTPSSTVPLAPSATSPRDRTNFNMWVNTTTTEDRASAIGSSSVEQSSHLSQEPLLVSPGSHTVERLPPFPSTSVPVAVTTTVAVPNVPADLAKKPAPIHLFPRKETQITVSDEQFQVNEEGLSSESSESLTSESDHQEEARDTFDTSK